MQSTAQTISLAKELVESQEDKEFSYHRSFKLDHASSTPSTNIHFDFTWRISFDKYPSGGGQSRRDPEQKYSEKFQT